MENGTNLGNGYISVLLDRSKFDRQLAQLKRDFEKQTLSMGVGVGGAGGAGGSSRGSFSGSLLGTMIGSRLGSRLGRGSTGRGVRAGSKATVTSTSSGVPTQVISPSPIVAPSVKPVWTPKTHRLYPGIPPVIPDYLRDKVPVLNPNNLPGVRYVGDNPMADPSFPYGGGGSQKILFTRSQILRNRKNQELAEEFRKRAGAQSPNVVGVDPIGGSGGPTVPKSPTEGIIAGRGKGRILTPEEIKAMTEGPAGIDLDIRAKRERERLRQREEQVRNEGLGDWMGSGGGSLRSSGYKGPVPPKLKVQKSNIGETFAKFQRSLGVAGGERMSAMIQLFTKNIYLAVAAIVVLAGFIGYKLVKNFKSITDETKKFGAAWKSFKETLGNIIMSAGATTFFKMMTGFMETLAIKTKEWANALTVALSILFDPAWFIKIAKGEFNWNPFKEWEKSTENIKKNLQYLQIEELGKYVQQLALRSALPEDPAKNIKAKTLGQLAKGVASDYYGPTKDFLGATKDWIGGNIGINAWHDKYQRMPTNNGGGLDLSTELLKRIADNTGKKGNNSVFIGTF